MEYQDRENRNKELKRMAELLAYASVCFEHCTNPFDRVHLLKMHVTADECGALSEAIAELIADNVDHSLVWAAGKKFSETQK